jgi:hypothetical protein
MINSEIVKLQQFRTPKLCDTGAAEFSNFTDEQNWLEEGAKDEI